MPGDLLQREVTTDGRPVSLSRRYLGAGTGPVAVKAAPVLIWVFCAHGSSAGEEQPAAGFADAGVRGEEEVKGPAALPGPIARSYC